MAGLMPEFQRRNCKIIGLSVDPVDDHSRWAKDIEETQGHAVTYPLIGTRSLRSPNSMTCCRKASVTLRRPQSGRQCHRALGVRDRTRQKAKAMLTYPMTSGRNFDEVLRLLDTICLRQ